MRLKSLELKGFKSFAKKAELEFSASITAIVGPNGSGKSNIAEAFRFALGEQSMKSMRGKRTEDLIWNGSQTVPRMNRASVTLNFLNEDRFLDIDFDQVSISRVIHRDASNEYLINDSQARLKDISELVNSANIGSTGHHIISQGEADRILNVSSKDRKLMLEDALGLKIYHYRIDESERKLERTNENLKEVKSLRRELAPHLQFLEKQVEKVKKAKEMREELEELYRNYFVRESFYIEDQKKNLNESLKAPKLKLKKIDKELSDAESRIKKESVSSEILESYKKTENKLDEIRSEKNKLERSLGRIEGEIDALQKIFERQKQKEEKLSKFLVEKNDLNRLKEKIVSVVEAGRSVGSFSGISDKVKLLFSGFLESIKKDKGEGGDTSGTAAEELEAKRKEVRELSGKLEGIKVLEGETYRKLLELQKKKEEEKDSYKDAEKEVFRLQAERSEVKSVLDELRGRLSRLELVEDEYKRDLSEAGALIGRKILDFTSGGASDEGGGASGEDTESDLSDEKREVQVQRKKDIERLKIRLEESGGSGGEDVMKEYKDTKRRDEYLEKEVEDLISSEKRLEKLITDLEETLKKKFHSGIDIINKEFEKFFSLMFGGGRASLEIVKIEVRKSKDTDISMSGDPDQDASEGIEIKVNLPHKKIKSLEMLSGGERALTSIALLFAMSRVNPPPFIILDETDAALDEANSRKYGDMIEKLSEDSQLILITHNRETMSRAGVLYGVTMGADGVSQMLSVKFEEAVRVAK